MRASDIRELVIEQECRAAVARTLLIYLYDDELFYEGRKVCSRCRTR